MGDDVGQFTRPQWKNVLMRCQCGHDWDDWLPSRVTINVWVASMRALRCPACGSGTRRLSLRTERPEIPRDD